MFLVKCFLAAVATSAFVFHLSLFQEKFYSSATAQTANNCLTIFAGVLINLGSISQIYSLLFRRRLKMNEIYFYCLTVGCVFLLLGQVWAYTFTSQTIEVMMTIVTSLLSFLCAFSILCIRLVLKHKRSKVTILEGVAGTGKTTKANFSFDYLHYIEQEPIFINKQQEMFLSILYDINLFSDLMLLFSHQNSRVHKNKCVIDRDVISQVAYAILFKFNGHKKLHSDFVAEVTDFLRLNAKLIKSTLKKYYKMRAEIFSGVTFETRIGVVDEHRYYDLLANNLIKRNTFEVISGYDLIAYSKNQSWLFRELIFLLEEPEIVGVGVTPFISTE